jgi:hypothetical protein
VKAEGENLNMTEVFIPMYENRIMKPAKIVFKSEEGEYKRVIEGVNLTKVHYMHEYKY